MTNSLKLLVRLTKPSKSHLSLLQLFGFFIMMTNSNGYLSLGGRYLLFLQQIYDWVVYNIKLA
jgi:hypothetical protein